MPNMVKKMETLKLLNFILILYIYIRVFVDNGQIYEILFKDGTENTGAFHNKFFFILNIAEGGNWPGFNFDSNQFPNKMLVDYIRVYQS